MWRLYLAAWKDTGEIAEELGIPEARVSRYVHYTTHFLGVHDLVPEGYDGDPYERLMPGPLSASAEQAVYRKVCIELLRELFDTLSKKDRDILGKAYGVFGYSEATLKEIGMYHMMKASAVEKAKIRAVEELREAYPGSRLQVWRLFIVCCGGRSRRRGKTVSCGAISRSMSAPWRRSMAC